jgi:hypothetical protein
MKIPFFTCLTCSQNNGNTQIKVKSSCFDKPLIINVDNEDSLVAIQEILTKILGVKEPAPTDTVVGTTVI